MMETQKPQNHADPELSFNLLSEGLGFHPFADGLPYAPLTKKGTTPRNPTTTAPATTMGAGAMAAGPAVFSPTITQPRISVPVATIQNTVKAPIIPAPKFGFAYLLKRLFAYSLDTLLNATLCVTTLSAALWKQDLDLQALTSPGIAAIFGVFLAFFNWSLITAQEVAFGTSAGKRLFGLVLDGKASSIFFREVLFVISIAVGGLGLLWSLFDGKKRCWHDIFSNVQPIEIARL